MRSIILSLLLICFVFLGNVSAQGVSNYKSWDNYPDVPRITAEEVKDLMRSGEKMIYVYAGYEIEEVLCNSVYIPYTWVPPSGSGAKVRPKFPKDWWVIAY